MTPRRPRPRALRAACAIGLVVASLCAPAAAAAAAPLTAQTSGDEYATPQFAGSSAAATRGPARSLRVPVPTSVSPGDVLVLGFAVRARAPRLGRTPAGWTLVRRDRGARTRLSQLIYVKVAAAREPGSYRWSWRERAPAAAGIIAYANVDQSAPVETHNGKVSQARARASGAGQAISLPVLTTRTPGARILAMYASPRRADTTAPAGATERYDISGWRVSAAGADHVQTVPGRVHLAGSDRARRRRGRAAASSDAVGQMVALRPKKRGGPKNTPLLEPAPLPLDIVPPDTTIDSGPSGTVGMGSATFTFSSSEPGSTFECRLDNAPWTPCGPPHSYSELSNGTHVFEVRARDAAGNVDLLPASRSWTVDVQPQDTTAPDSTITSGPSGTTSSTSASFTFVSNEPGSAFECRLDAASWEACTSPAAFSDLADGAHTFRVRATDAAGNVESSYSSRSWTIDTSSPPPPPDTTPPDTSISSGPSGTTTSTSATFEFNSTEAGSSFECRLDGAAWAPCSSPRGYTGLATGTHTFDARATDTAGNTDTTPATRSWTIEATPPPPPPPPGGGANLPAPLAESTGTVFHIAKTGSDTNPGTAAAPWLTVQKALNTLQAGQKALVHAGTYTQALDLTRACTQAAPCTVEAAPGEPRPVLRITNDHVLRAETSAAYWRFRGFTFRDSDITSGGLVDLYGHHIEISGSELTNSGDQAFYMDEASHHIQVLGNWIHHSGLGRTHQSHGAYLQGNDHLVANNVIHDMPFGFGIQVYDKGLRSIIVNNTIAHNGHSGIVVGGSGGVSGVVVRNNVFAGNNHHGIAWDGTCPNSTAGTTYVDHNVIFGNGWGAIDTQSCPATSTAGGNRTTDPLFVDAPNRNFHLRAGSPAFGYALPEWSPGGDHDGEARPQNGAPDAGAYEEG